MAAGERAASYDGLQVSTLRVATRSTGGYISFSTEPFRVGNNSYVSSCSTDGEDAERRVVGQSSRVTRRLLCNAGRASDTPDGEEIPWYRSKRTANDDLLCCTQHH